MSIYRALKRQVMEQLIRFSRPAKIRLVTSEEEFLALEGPWNEILAEAGNRNVFLTFEWLSTWWAHFKNSYQLFAAVAEKGGKIVAIAPLVIAKNGGVPELRFMGQPGSDFLDFIVRPHQSRAVKQMLSFLETRNGWDILCLEGIPEDSPVFPLLDRKRKKHPVLGRSSVHNSNYFIPIKGPWEAGSSGLKKSLVADAQKKEKKLEKCGRVFLSRPVRKDDLRRLTKVLLDHKVKKYGLGQKLFSVDPSAWLDFYSEVLGKFAEKGWLHFSVLHFEEKEIAISLNFTYKRIFSCYMISFDPEYSRFSPGTIQMLRLIRQAHEEGYEKFDFLAGQEKFKTDWTASMRQLHDFKIHKRSAGGIGAFVLAAASRRLRAVAAMFLGR